MWTGLVLPAGPLQGPVWEAGSSSQTWKNQSPVDGDPHTRRAASEVSGVSAMSIEGLRAQGFQGGCV